MKKILLFLGIFLLVLSCSEDFLDRPPLGELTSGTFPNSEEDAILALNGSYNIMRNWQFNTGGFPLLDIMSDETTKGSNPGDAVFVNLFNDFGFTPSENAIASWWGTLYEGVRRANLVIENVEDIEGMDAALQQRILGEARFLRGYFYSALVRGFGDVVIVTSTAVDFSEQRSRSPKEQVWEEIIFPDLQFAVDALPEKSEYTDSDYGRATKGAARALLTRLYLFVGDFSNAEKYALDVINSNEYQLEDSFSSAFAEDNPHGNESIFEIGAVRDQGRDLGGHQWGNTQGVRGTPQRGWGFNRPSYPTILSFGDDPRLDPSVLFLGEEIDGFTIIGDDSTPDTTYDDQDNIIEIECYNQKVWEPTDNKPPSYNVNRRIIRYADVLLMAAEALNENNKSADALPYINAVRERARGDNDALLPDITTTDQSELRQAIYTERSRELAFEGLRFWDLVRTDRAAEVLGPLGFIEGTHEVFPIPQSEIDVSEGALMQNPGY